MEKTGGGKGGRGIQKYNMEDRNKKEGRRCGRKEQGKGEGSYEGIGRLGLGEKSEMEEDL